MPDLPRLIAFDADDLAVIAANLQDALVRVGEMAFLPQSKQFAMVAARFDWVRAAAKKSGRPCCERCRTANTSMSRIFDLALFRAFFPGAHELAHSGRVWRWSEDAN